MSNPFFDLCYAAEKGNTKEVQRLLDECDLQQFLTEDPDHANALDHAVNGGHIDCAKILVNVYDPKSSNCFALRIASLRRDQKMFDLLYPLSDPELALRTMESEYFMKDDPKIRMLRNRVHAERERHTLNEAVTGTHKARQSKKI